MSEPLDNTVQDWVNTWPKHTLTDNEYTLIVGNLYGFYAWLVENNIAVPKGHERRPVTVEDWRSQRGPTP